MEAYYQEIGRAGRDGRAAVATLLWDAADIATRGFFIESPRTSRPGRMAADPAETARRKEIERLKLERMIAYAGTMGCLRATILRYFGATPAFASRAAHAATTGPRAGDTTDLPPGLARLPAAGVLKHVRPGAVDRWIDAAVSAGLLAISKDQYRTLGLTPLGRDVMNDRVRDFAHGAPPRPVTFAIRRRLRRYRRRGYGFGGSFDDW